MLRSPPRTITPAQIAVHEALTTTPLLADIQGVALDASFRKTIGGESPDCGSQVAPKPVAVIDIQNPSPNMHISVNGARNDGFVVKKGSLFWTVCTDTIRQVPEMAPPKEGWQPGALRDLSGDALREGRARAITSRLRCSIPTTSRRGARRSAASSSSTSSTSRCSSRCRSRADRQQRREGLSGYGCRRPRSRSSPTSR